MKLKHLIPIVLLVGALPWSTAFSADYGTAAEAKAMLERVVAELKKDKSAALAKFNNDQGRFRDRDLYPFCASSPDGILTAHPTMVGENQKQLKDATGKPFGKEIHQVAEEGKFKKVSYMWPRPGSTKPVPKVSFVTKVGDQICGVGYYKQ
jgi:signal transduction histidine kinase